MQRSVSMRISSDVAAVLAGSHAGRNLLGVAPAAMPKQGLASRRVGQRGRRERRRRAHGRSNTTGRDKGERKAMPSMCGTLDRRVEREVPETVEQRVDGDPGLHASEVHAEADMHTEAEADVLALFAEHVVEVGVGVLALVPIGRTDHEGDVGALLDVDPGQLGVPGGPAQDDGDRRLPAQRLLEGLREEGAVAVERVELGAVGEQGVEQAARGPVGGLDAGRAGSAAGRSRSPRRSGCSPSTSTRTRSLIRSSPGSARRSAMTPAK